jgi:hypothetical protein
MGYDIPADHHGPLPRPGPVDDRKMVDVRLVDTETKLYRNLQVRLLEDGTMPKSVIIDNRTFDFDNGLSHCGELYRERSTK